MSYKLDFKDDILNVQEANPVLCSGQFANVDAANTALRLILIKHVIPELIYRDDREFKINIQPHNLTVTQIRDHVYLAARTVLIILNVSIVWVDQP